MLAILNEDENYKILYNTTELSEEDIDDLLIKTLNEFLSYYKNIKASWTYKEPVEKNVI